jgi:hypothetical protein
VLKREATVMLAGIKINFHDERELGHRMLDELRQNNRSSPLVLSVSGTVCRGEGKLDEAFAHYKAALALQFDAPQLRCTISYHMGNCHFVRLDYEPAAANLEYFLEHTSGKVFRCARSCARAPLV